MTFTTFATMAYDYAERLYDFRPNDFATFRRGSATMTELPISHAGVGGFFAPWGRPSRFRLIGGGGSTGAAWALPWFRPGRGGVFAFYNV